MRSPYPKTCDDAIALIPRRMPSTFRTTHSDRSGQTSTRVQSGYTRNDRRVRCRRESLPSQRKSCRQPAASWLLRQRPPIQSSSP
jgi:hypothetical protein